ncbi:MAG TPA: FAD-dependent oxidoreductase [Caldilineaceae bacterium]|nr:FAD-dependent oxidoreductase [Caldilineaceae bacterium]
MLTYSKAVPIIATPEVLVCGAGLAGIGAAVAAARSGAQVMVIERNGFAGGFFTAIIGSAFDGFVDERTGTPVVGGIVFEMLERMGVIQPGQGPRLRYNVNGDFSFVEMHPERVIPRCDPERFKRAADAILLEAGVQVLYHSQVADVITKTGRIESVMVSNKAGLVAIQPKVVIDCTGDGDVAAWAGVPFEKAEALQPMSLHFRIAYLEPSFDLRRRCAAVLQAAHERGELGLYAGPYPATFSGRDVYFNATRTPGDNTDPADWTHAEIQGRRDAWTMFELWQKELPEFAESYFMTSGPVAGARESRRIVGDYVLTGEDVRQGRMQDDVVVLGAWRLDRHPANQPGYHDIPWTPPYAIPYRTLLPQGVENLLVAGRCHSATSEALASSRVTATAMGMGQAAGIAAALATQEKQTPREVNLPQLQAQILQQGGILTAPESDVAVGNPRW